MQGLVTGRAASGLFRLFFIGLCILLLTGPIGRPVEVRPPVGLPGQHVDFTGAIRDRVYRDAHNGRSVDEERAFQRLVVGATIAVDRSKENRAESLADSGFGDLNIRMPDSKNESMDAVIHLYAKETLVPKLKRKVNADKIFVVNSALDVGSDVVFSEKIPGAVKDRSREIAKYFNEPPAETVGVTIPVPGQPDGSPFSKLPAGAVLILIGHINAAAGKFIGGDREFSVSSLSAMAQKYGINLFFLGCNSAEVAPVGVPRPIESTAVIQGVGDYLSVVAASGEFTMAEFYSQVSRHGGEKVLIDPFRFDVYFESVVVDSSGKAVRVNYIYFYEPPPAYSSGSTSASSEPARGVEISGARAVSVRVEYVVLVMIVSALCGLVYNMLRENIDDIMLGLVGHFILVFPASWFYSGGGGEGNFIPLVVFVGAVLSLLWWWRRMSWLGRVRLAIMAAACFIYW